MIENNAIVMIPTENLLPHPQNPRHDVGDIAELAESIKANGVLQNLTVVPHPDNGPLGGEYRVVIGHRRLAAAVHAGLTELPCVVASMDEKEQIATMLLENIQRSDLTPLEQAEGFQLMLDFGETVETIAEQTGFSQSTVRRRTKLLDLDRDNFRASVERGGTLEDFAKLDQLKDPDRKNTVLGKVGTNNFDYELKKAMEEEQREDVRAGIIAQLDTFAQPIETRGADMVQVDSWQLWSVKEIPEITVPEDAGQTEYYYTNSSYGLTLFRKRDEVEPPAMREETEEERRRRENKAQLEEISKRAYTLRYDFVKNFSATKKQAKVIMEFAVHSMLADCYSSFSDFPELMGIATNDEDEASQEDIQAAVSAAPERALLMAAYCMMGDSSNERYHDWNGWYSENKELDLLYDHLEKLGYELSDEEKVWRDGTLDAYPQAVDCTESEATS